MFTEMLNNTAFQWIFGITGTAILIAIAYYVLTNLRKEIKTPLPSREEHLVEFDRMVQRGTLRKEEFLEVKKNLGKEIVEKTKTDYRRKENT